MTPCPRCGTDGPVLRGADRAVTRRTVAARGERIPVVHCPAGHRDPVPAGAVADEAVHDALPHATRRGLRRREVCGRCGAELTMPVRRTERAVTVVDERMPVTTLRFDLPSTRCPGCGAEQVPVRSQHDLAASVTALFAAADDDSAAG